MTTQYDLSDLPQAERSVLQQVYGMQSDSGRGYAPNQIAYVRDLTEQEKLCLEQRSTLSFGGALLQILYKIDGNLLPPRFNRAIHAVSQQAEALRLNYCPVGSRFLAVVFQERRELPEIVFRNLEQLDDDELDSTLQTLMDADMRRGFDLRHGTLLRFSVFHTGRDEYAVILTAVRAILEKFDARSIFRASMGLPELRQAGDVLPRPLSRQMEQPIRQYWSRMLSDLPPAPRLPFARDRRKGGEAREQQGAYLMRLPEAILSDLKRQAKSNKTMLVAILQMAWGLLLQESSGQSDVAYCILLPSREGDGLESLVPVRLRVDGDPALQELSTKSFQQLVISQPYASMGREDIQEILGERVEQFDHFLNFCSFFEEEKPYSKAESLPDGNIVQRVNWDTRDVRLGLGFRASEDHVTMSFLYNFASFSEDGMKILGRQYILVLQQMLLNWNVPFSDFMEQLQNRLRIDRAEALGRQPDTRKALQDCLSRLDLFKECELGTVQLFMSDARLVTRFEGDRISGKEIEEQAVFVVDGRVSRSIETGDGWYNTMDILKERSWANELLLLPQHKTKLSLEILTEQATLLTIPFAAFRAILLKSTTPLGRSIIQHMARQMEKYQRLWIQS